MLGVDLVRLQLANHRVGVLLQGVGPLLGVLGVLPSCPVGLDVLLQIR